MARGVAILGWESPTMESDSRGCWAGVVFPKSIRPACCSAGYDAAMSGQGQPSRPRGVSLKGVRRARAAGFTIGWLVYFYLYLDTGRLPSSQLGINQAGVWLHDYVMTNCFATLAAGIVGAYLGNLAFRRGDANL
jgi:hypothetical protein